MSGVCFTWVWVLACCSPALLELRDLAEERCSRSGAFESRTSENRVVSRLLPQELRHKSVTKVTTWSLFQLEDCWEARTRTDEMLQHLAGVHGKHRFSICPPAACPLHSSFITSFYSHYCRELEESYAELA